MSTLSSLGSVVLQRLEENPASPQFWQTVTEIYPFLVEAMNEAALITGEPQFRNSTPFTLAANTTYFNVPSDCVALLRVEGGNQIQKTSIWDLDREIPGWENDKNGTQPDYWFPVGLTQFGIHPQLAASATVLLSYVKLPVATGRPYTGAEASDFQSEYDEGFIDYAVTAASLKEGTEEFTNSVKVNYQRFLERMGELSKFAMRKAVLRFSRTMGASARIDPIKVR